MNSYHNLTLNWLYLDINSYFATVEQHYNPSYRNKPLIVVPLDSNTTCAIAASIEAKKLGVKTGTNVCEAKRMVPDLICVKSNHDKYRGYHHRILKEIDKHIYVDDILSIDECAGRLTGKFQLKQNAVELAYKIKKGITNNIGDNIKCSVGIAPNRFLAKIATEIEKVDGLVVLEGSDLPKKLYSLNLRSLTGIGASTYTRLISKGINSVECLCNKDVSTLKKAFGNIVGEKYYYLLRGCNMPEEKKDTQSIGNSQILPPEMRNPNNAYDAARRLLLTATSRLREKEFYANGINLELSLANKGSLKNYQRINSLCDDFSLGDKMKFMWDSLINNQINLSIKKISISFINLTKQKDDQLVLFNNDIDCNLREKNKLEQISKLMDKINKKEGKNIVSLGVARNRDEQAEAIAFSSI
ncbi:MAG: DNA-directed DNA polymerase [Candidatus Midichloriaceae bacterium]